METKSFKIHQSPGGESANLEPSKAPKIHFDDAAVVGLAASKQLKNKHRRLKNKKHPRLQPFEKRYSTLSEANKLIPEKKCIDYVLIYQSDSVDTDASESERTELKKCENYRQRFEEKLKKEGFTIDKHVSNNYVYTKLHCPFKRLCFEAERVKLEMPLKDCEIPEPPPLGILQTFAAKYLETDGEIADYVSAPFQMNKIHLFEGHEDPGNFFRPSIRSLLVHHILINIDVRSDKEKSIDETEEVTQEESKCIRLCKSIICFCQKAPLQPVDKQNRGVMKRKGLQFLLMKNVYTDSMVLHDEPSSSKEKDVSPSPNNPESAAVADAIKELDKKWSKFYTFQPMWQIRNYFGEKIGLYFAWTGALITTLWIPMLFGVAVFIYGLYESLTDSAIKNNSTSLGLQDVLEDVKEAFDNDVTPYFALFICCWGTIFLEYWKRKCATLAYEWDVDQFETNEPDRPQFYGTVVKKDPITNTDAWFYPFKRQLLKFSTSAAVLIFMVCIVIASVFAVIVYRVIMNIDYCPNMSNKECLLLTTIVSSILNAVSILLLGKIYDKLAIVLTEWENHRTQTSYDDSLIIKLFAFQFVNSYASCFYVAFVRGHGSLFEDRYVDTCEGSCMTQLSFQILTLMIVKPFPKFFKDIGIPLLKKIWQRLRFSCQKNQVKDDIELHGPKSEKFTQESFLEHERSKPDLNDFTMGEYTEKIILYGFLMLFACSFPLAPLMAIIICLIDIRVDAKRLLWLFRRPIAHIAEDIGMWYNILNFVNFVGVLTNAFIIAFTSNWGSQFNITGKLAVVIGFEHIVFFLKFLLAYLIPDVPEDVKLAMRREKYLVQRKMEKENKAIDDFTRLFPDENIKEEDSEADKKEASSSPHRKKSLGEKIGTVNPAVEIYDIQEENSINDGQLAPIFRTFEVRGPQVENSRMITPLSTSDSHLVTKPKKSSHGSSVFHLKFKSSSFHRMHSNDDPSAETLISEA